MQTLFWDMSQLQPSNGTPTPAKSYGNAPPTAGFQACGCTRETYGCTTHPNTPDEWTSYMRASLVRMFRQPENARELAKARGQTSTPRLSASFAKYDRAFSTWRTFQQSLGGGCSQLSWQTWPKSGLMKSDGSVYELPTWAPTIIETGGGVWLTPHGFSQDGKSNGPSGNELGRKVNLSLIWPSPTASECSGGGQNPEKRKSGGHHVRLRDAVMFPTPTVQDSANNAGPSQLKRNTLPLNVVDGGSLNPTWVEWLMGFPLGSTASRDWETRKSRSKPQPRG